MDVLIKNMEMPKEGFIRLILEPNGTVKKINLFNEAVIQTDAKAIELPPHGRLIDVEPIEKEVKTWTSAGLDKYDFLYELDHAEVVVEANYGSDN